MILEINKQLLLENLGNLGNVTNDKTRNDTGFILGNAAALGTLGLVGTGAALGAASGALGGTFDGVLDTSNYNDATLGPAGEALRVTPETIADKINTDSIPNMNNVHQLNNAESDYYKRFSGI